MLPGGKNMKDLMKQAQKMQAEMMKSQEELENKIFEAASGGGMVKIEMNGKYELKSIKLDPEAVDPNDVEMLEDLIAAALNDAVRRGEALSKEKMAGFTSGLNLPPGFKLPF